MITLQNNSKATLIHGEYTLFPDGIADVPERVAKIWQKIEEVIEYKDPQEAKAEKKALEDENAKLKAEIAKLKEANKAAKANNKAKANK